EPGALCLRLQRDFHGGRAQRQWAVLRPPGKHDAGVGRHLQILASDYLAFVDVNAADATRLRIEGRANAQPAYQFLWLGEVGENTLRSRRNIQVTLDHLPIRCGHGLWISFLRLPPPASGAADARPKSLPENSAALQNLLGEHDTAVAFLCCAPSRVR